MTESHKLVSPDEPLARPKVQKKKIQLTWENIHITAMPAQGKCCKGQGMLKEEKVIINGVSGTVMPGQFLAIIGASGKLAFA